MRALAVADLQRDRLGLVAAGPPLTPPREWFEVPEPEDPSQGTWTVTADGQVYGYAALWDSCHTGKPGRCVKPPRSASQYGYYMTGLTEVDDGELIPTGRITLGTGHASLTASPAATAEHYDNTGAVAADVRITDGQHGIWVSGALRPDMTPERARELRGASLSGDWRNIRGKLEMLGLLAVNVPGFPVPRTMTASAEYEGHEEVMAMVAAGVIEGPLIMPEQLEDISDDEFEAGLQNLLDAMALSEAVTSIDPVDAALATMSAAAFLEQDHPREPGGTGKGGQFTFKAQRTRRSDDEGGSWRDETPEEYFADVEKELARLEKGVAGAQEEMERSYKRGDMLAIRMERKADVAKAIARRDQLKAQLARERKEGAPKPLQADGGGPVPRFLEAYDKPETRYAEAGGGEGVAPEVIRLEEGQWVSYERDGETFYILHDGTGLRELTAAGFFEESKHPRHPKGMREGGRFAPKVGDKIQYDADSPREEVTKVYKEDGQTVVRTDASNEYAVGPGGELKSLYEPATGGDEDSPAKMRRDLESGERSAEEILDSLSPEQDPALAEPPEAFIERERADIERRVKEGALTTAEGQQLTEQAWAEYERRKGLHADAELTPEEEELVADASPGRARSHKIAEVMREFKAGKLKSSDGKKVTDRKQALAIAMSESEDLTAAGEQEEQRAAESDPMDLPAARPPEPRPDEAILAASFTAQQREKLAKKGQAMPDGSFPIRNRTELRNAIADVGRASDPDAARRWIIRRARELKAVHELPASWDVDDSVQAAGFFDETKHPRHEKGTKQGGEFAPKGDARARRRSEDRAARQESVSANIAKDRLDHWRGFSNELLRRDLMHGRLRESDRQMIIDILGERASEGKLVEGPGGRMMSRAEKSELLDKQRAGTPSAKADRAAKAAREEGDTPAYLQTPNQETPESRLEAARATKNWDKSLDREPEPEIAALADRFKTPRGTLTTEQYVLASFPELSPATAKAVASEVKRRQRLEGIRAGRVRYTDADV